MDRIRVVFASTDSAFFVEPKSFVQKQWDMSVLLPRSGRWSAKPAIHLSPPAIGSGPNAVD